MQIVGSEPLAPRSIKLHAVQLRIDAGLAGTSGVVHPSRCFIDTHDRFTDPRIIGETEELALVEIPEFPIGKSV